MNDLWNGIQQAIWLTLTLDADLVEISLRSLRVTLSALFVSCLIALPLAAILAVRRFKYRRLIISTLNALDGIAPCRCGADCLYFIVPLWSLWGFRIALYHPCDGDCAGDHHHTPNHINCASILARVVVRIS